MLRSFFGECYDGAGWSSAALAVCRPCGMEDTSPTCVGAGAHAWNTYTPTMAFPIATMSFATSALLVLSTCFACMQKLGSGCP
mmetsp:Transcript_22357/g.55906  ORF Transcript_22357/g.55906 Transcript_22357/m.55906 type:complete len:83 (+) Transcript_22357:781-1029(+)